MRKALFTLLAVLLVTGSLVAAEKAHLLYRVDNDPSFAGYVPNMIIVQLEEDVIPTLSKQAQKSGDAFRESASLDAVGRRLGVSQVDKKFSGMWLDNAVTPEERALTRFFRVHVEGGNVEEAIEAYEALPEVTQAYKIPLHYMDATPNDPLWSSQWHYYNAYGVDADEAWDIETGDATVVVGILDSGVKYDHGDLGGSNPPGPNDNSTNGNIWVNDLEIPGNGVDDDGNGFIDDVIGYDFLVSSFRCRDADCGTADNDPMDGLGHGTHVSGTVGAINNNGYRVAGVAGGYNDGTTGSTANGVKILCCRIGYKTSNSGVVDMDAAADAMVYTGQLKARGVNVAAINCSWGSSQTADLTAAVDYLVSQDVLICVSAGNSNSTSYSYLAGRPDCFSVGATDINGNPASFSNYGSWVEVAAPGVSVLSTYVGTSDNTYTMNGTSMASPHVAGVAALLESYDPGLSMQDKWDLMIDPANVKPYNQTKDVGEGIVSAKLCLDAIGGSSCTDPPVANFSGTPLSGDYPLTVNFTDLSTNNPTGWDWNFGDGSPHVYTQNPSHQYTSAGTYTVTLTASNACGSDGETKTAYITVTAPPPPVAAFVGSPTSGDYPLTVNFTDQSTNNPTAWDWNFGDGSAHVYTQNPSHIYTAEGTYTVTLIASNASGSDTEEKIGYITVTQPVNPPVAAFTGTPTSGEIPLEVTFTDESTGGATSWEWNFGDGSPVSYDQNPVHTYTAAGDYTVTLTVSNAYGSDDEIKTDYISAFAGGENTMYVYDIDVWRQRVGWRCDSYTQIWIYDQNNQPLEGADVTVEVTGPVNGSGTFTTLADGSITVHTGVVSTCSGDFCWEVLDVVKTDYTYDSGANNMTKVCESGVVYKSEPANDAQSLVPDAYGLSQNYPNPFNPTTEISFSLPNAGNVKLEVFNIRGQKVATLADGFFGAGVHTVTWDGTRVSSGIYLYRLQADDFVEKKKMILLK